jgi:7-cyano-7-deazaguanine synthase
MKSIALVSGGLDSLVSLAMARKDSDVILALNFDYGQKAAAREAKASEEIAKYYNIIQWSEHAV